MQNPNDISPFQVLVAGLEFAEKKDRLCLERAVGPDWARVVTALVARPEPATRPMRAAPRPVSMDPDTIVDATTEETRTIPAYISVSADFLRVMTQDDLRKIFGVNP